MEKSRYKMPDGLEVIFENQSVLTVDEINAANQFNDADNDVAILEITMINNTDEVISFNRFGFSFATHNEIQLKDFGVVWSSLPDEYNTMDSFSAGDLMLVKDLPK